MWMPPIFVRRVFIDPLIFLGSLVAVIVSPIAFLIAFIADLFISGRWKALRMTKLAVTFLLYEVVGLVAAFVLWLASGFGVWIRKPSMVRMHYKLLGWWVTGISRAVQKAFGLDIALPDQPHVRGPLLVFSRHAGPGDSVFLAGVLLGHFNRYPRIVGKKELEFAPLFDILGHRLPMRFIRPHPKRQELALEAVRDAASHLGPQDAFVLFPEGGNYTPKRRKRAIESLERHGYEERAEAAKELENLLPPHTTGPLAAIEQSPEADVVFVAHTGTEDMISFEIIWGGIPFDRTIRTNYWHVPSSEIPDGSEERVAWLYEWWETVDTWIGENKETGTGDDA